MTDINRTDFNYGGSIDGMKDITDEELIDIVAIFRQRASDSNYHMEADNFDCSIFLHRIWILNYLMTERKFGFYKITEMRKELQQEGIESAEHEHELVHDRINDLFKVPQ